MSNDASSQPNPDMQLVLTPVRTTVHTQETPATKPARTAALGRIASLSDRALAFFHWREANELVDTIQHKVRDYDAEKSNFQPHEAEEIAQLVPSVIEHLQHVVAIATESGGLTRDVIRAAAAGRGAPTYIDDSGMRWTYVEDGLPDDGLRCAIAIEGEDSSDDEPEYGYHEDGKWWYDTAPHLSPVEAKVYAWAEVPSVPPRRKGGAS